MNDRNPSAMDTTDYRKCSTIDSKNDRNPAAIKGKHDQNCPKPKIIRNDTNTKLVFPPDCGEEIETPLVELGSQNNQRCTLQNVVENNDSSPQEIEQLVQSEDCDICYSDLFHLDKDEGGELCVMKECNHYCHKRYFEA